MQKGQSISKKEASILQGIAVLLMVFHHLFDFPDRIHVPFVQVFDFIKLEIFLSSFGKICVAMFAFLSGVGLYKKFSAKFLDKKFPILQCYGGMVSQLFNFLKRYWLVFAVFIPYGFATNVYSFHWKTFWGNLFGIDSSYNGEWWYVLQYFDLLCMFPILFCLEALFSSIIKRNGNLWSALILLIPFSILFIWQDKTYNFCFLLGILSASTNAMDWLFEKLSTAKWWKYIVGCLLLVTAFVCRIKFIGAKYDYINVSLFIVGLLIIIKSDVFKKYINPVFAYIGKYSTYIWLTHTFFAYYFFQSLTFFPKYSILIYVWCVLLSLASGIILDTVLKIMGLGIKKTGLTKLTARFFQRVGHFWERIVRETKRYPQTKKVFGKKVARVTFKDGLKPLGKSPEYIETIQSYVDDFLADIVEKHNALPDESVYNPEEKVKIWCCWWQGVEQMPEIVKMCHQRLKSVLPTDKAELHVITLDNYLQYIDLPEHIIDKFNRKIITMTTMSDILRFRLLEKYGGYWLDATVFFSDAIPAPFFSGKFYCQRMAKDIEKVSREACKGNWCGFSMAGPAHSPVFRFMNDAFDKWWAHYDTIIEYVLIDYMLMTGFKNVTKIHEIIDAVPDNNPEIFEFYKKLNEPYSDELYAKLTKTNVLHKLTYKMDLYKQTQDGQDTLYGRLLKEIFGEKEDAVI